MKYKDFINLNWSKPKAYILGLLFTRIDIGLEVKSSKNYLIGQIAHNSNMATDDDIISHLMNLTIILRESSIDLNDITIDNSDIKVVKENVNKGRRSGKKGFVVAVELDNINNENLDQMKNIINEELMELVNNIPREFIPSLIAGTIDGRSSYDTTMGYISIDIDRDSKKQNLIEKMTKEYGYDVNINRRGKNHSKADQLRYRPSDIPEILSDIPLISDARINIFKKRES